MTPASVDPGDMAAELNAAHAEIDMLRAWLTRLSAANRVSTQELRRAWTAISDDVRAYLGEQP